MAERKVVVVDGKGGGPMFRAIGTCDIDGNGTTFDLPDGSPFQSAGPFVLLDVVTMPSVAGFKAPFCAHPHSGAIVCSVLIEGKEFRAWDNVRGAEPDLLTPGGVYKLDSAYGCVHDEKPDPISLRGCTKAVFAEGEDKAAEGFCFCQLWINPGGLESLDSKPMASQVVQPDEISIVNEGALTVRLLAGSYGGATSPLSLPDELQLVLMHGRLEAGGSAELALPPGHEGFMVLVKDSAPATVDGQPVAPRQTAIIGHGDSGLKIAAANKDSPVYFLLGLGVPSTKGFAKLLGFGGALLEATEDAVRAKMEVYASDPQGFGREICSDPAAAEGLPDLSSDLAQYKMVEGFQNNGDDLMPGKEARWTLAVDDAAS